MSPETQDIRKTRVYAIALAVCGIALIFGLLNGVARGHWEFIGLAAVIVIGANMAILVRRGRGKRGIHRT